ncbi:hypothetical protein FRB94_009891 [Tulasnella sp. JGI-2019a]|nr:hypothetical protein FRB94_009891 [Tulasnella sp. JGI-2019a]
MSNTVSKYESHINDGDQKDTGPQVDANRYNHGKENAHAPFDLKDDRSLADRAAASVQRETEEDAAVAEAHAKPPTAAALQHSNKPSRGAEIDERIQKDEERELEHKGKI